MKIKNVYIKPDGQICACIVPVPEEPKEWLDDEGYMASLASPLYARKMKEYRQALKACKESAVRFEDQRAIGWRLTDTAIMKGIEVDTFYSIECEVEIIDDCDCINFDCLVPCAMADKYCNKKKVARLIPEAKTPALDEVFKNIPKGKYDQHYKGTAPIVEESQVLLWKRALNHSGSKIDPIKWLSDNFIITRKP